MSPFRILAIAGVAAVLASSTPAAAAESVAGSPATTSLAQRDGRVVASGVRKKKARRHGAGHGRKGRRKSARPAR